MFWSNNLNIMHSKRKRERKRMIYECSIVAQQSATLFFFISPNVSVCIRDHYLVSYMWARVHNRAFRSRFSSSFFFLEKSVAVFFLRRTALRHIADPTHLTIANTKIALYLSKYIYNIYSLVMWFRYFHTMCVYIHIYIYMYVYSRGVFQTISRVTIIKKIWQRASLARNIILLFY